MGEIYNLMTLLSCVGCDKSGFLCMQYTLVRPRSYKVSIYDTSDTIIK